MVLSGNALSSNPMSFTLLCMHLPAEKTAVSKTDKAADITVFPF